MKRNIYTLLAAVFSAVILSGFECGSLELTSARVYYSQKNWEKALEMAQNEVLKNPGSAEGWFLIGCIKNEKKEFAEMTESFKKCLKIDSVTHKTEIKNMIRQEWARAFNEGVANFNKAISNDDKSAYEKSIQDFNNAIILEPDSIQSYNNIASSYLAIGDLEKSTQYLKKVAEKKDDINAFISLGNIYSEKGSKNLEKFEAENKDKIQEKSKLDNIVKDVSKATVRKYLGEPDSMFIPLNIKQAAKKKDIENGEEWIYKKFNLHVHFSKENDLVLNKQFIPSYPYTIDSSQYFNAVEEWGKAIIWFSKAKDMATDSIKLSIIEQLSKLYTLSNRLDTAIQLYQNLVNSEPNNFEYHSILGRLFLDQKRFEEAAKEFKIAVDLKPEDEQAYYNLFVVFNNWAINVRNEKDNITSEDTSHINILRQGLASITKLNIIKPDNIDYIESLRSVFAILQMKQELEKLLIRLKNMESIHNLNPFYWETLAKCYTSNNKVNEALSAYNNADKLRKQK
jgi:tetratricopeptide (TPR) repeat protein